MSKELEKTRGVEHGFIFACADLTVKGSELKASTDATQDQFVRYYKKYRI